MREWLPIVLMIGVASGHCATIEGQVRLLERGDALNVVEDVAVYFRPDTPDPGPPPDMSFEMATHNKEFEPRVLPIPVGATVRFPNQDPILHNVFSSSPRNNFDLGLYGPGNGESHTFDQVGLVRVYCNVHQTMVAHILVLDTPHFTIPAADGRFRLEGVAETPGTLYIWHPRARAPLSIPVQLPLNETVDAELALTQRKVPDHKNKHGKSYRRDRRERY